MTHIIICMLTIAAAQDHWFPWTPENKPEYRVKKATSRPGLDGAWDSPVWQAANELQITNFLTEGASALAPSDHRPDTRARVLYDDDSLYLTFRVKDKYVRAIATEYRGKVWEDACVEFFMQPKADRGYFNFEINCGGTLLLSYHENPQWKGEINLKDGGVPWDLAKDVVIFHSMPQKIDPEIARDTTWLIEYRIPLKLLEQYVGPLQKLAGQTWRANFYKCAETNSHPHWAAWSPIERGYDFHSPKLFGLLHFE